jgi:hypothetical protein
VSADLPPPPPDQVTTPDQLDPGARAALDFLDGEKVVHAWRTSLGFLVLTNLRLLSAWHRPKILGFGASDWNPGPGFFLYALEPPKIVAGRFLEIKQDQAGVEDTGRFLVQDPEAVSASITEALTSGRRAWEARRAQVSEEMRLRESVRAATPLPSGSVREVVRVIVRVPCRYCGALMDEGAARCPTCGAAQH